MAEHSLRADRSWESRYGGLGLQNDGGALCESGYVPNVAPVEQ